MSINMRFLFCKGCSLHVTNIYVNTFCQQVFLLLSGRIKQLCHSYSKSKQLQTIVCGEMTSVYIDKEIKGKRSQAFDSLCVKKAHIFRGRLLETK